MNPESLIITLGHDCQVKDGYTSDFDFKFGKCLNMCESNSL